MMGKRKRRGKTIWHADPFADTGSGERPVREVRDGHRQTFQRGLRSTCVCCGQIVQPYARKVNGEMARTLRALAHGGPQTGKELSVSAGLRGGDYGKLISWGLIGRLKGGNERGSKFAITELGAAFITGRAHIPMYAIMYNGKTWGFSEEQATIADTGEPFTLPDTIDPRNIYNPEAE